MQTLLVSLFFIVGILSYAQSRKQLDEYFLQSPNEFDLLQHVQNRKNHRQQSNDNELEREQFINPRFFPWLKPVSKKSYSQPTNFYGRKSHWDTFFGRK